MAVSLTAKLSATAGNQVGYGSDNGLYVPPAAAASGGLGWIIDNYFAASGAQWWYQQTTYSNNQITQAANTAQIWPVMFAKSCRITDAQIYVQTAGAGSALYVSLYNSAGPNKQPGAKITDLFRCPTTATGISRATNIDSTTVLAAQTLYWAVNWTYTTGGYPSVYGRTAYHGYVRAVALQAAMFGQSGSAMTESTQGWSGLTAAPSSLASVTQLGAVAQGNANFFPPFIWWGVTNT